MKCIFSLNQHLLLESNERDEYVLHLAARGGHSSIMRELINCIKETPPGLEIMEKFLVFLVSSRLKNVLFEDKIRKIKSLNANHEVQRIKRLYEKLQMKINPKKQIKAFEDSQIRKWAHIQRAHSSSSPAHTQLAQLSVIKLQRN
ncbi:hypothetical protein LguiA_031040 [Lonicera macranthoides]